jgi:predicted TPR repeat methyltransferase
MQDSTQSIEQAQKVIAAAKTARAEGDDEAAAGFYRQALALCPGKKSFVAAVADGLRDCGKWSEAVTLLENATQRWPVSAMLLGRLSRAYLDLNDFARAAKCLREYLNHDPRETRFWRLLGDLHMDASEFSDAATAYSHVLTAAPLDVSSSIRRGDAFLRLGRIEEAIADYRRAAALEPANPAPPFKLGILMLDLGSPNEAAVLLQRSLQIDGQNMTARRYLSLALSGAGQFDAAAQIAESVLNVDQSSFQARYALGIALNGLGNFDAASAALTPAARDAPDNTDVLMALAEAETCRGQTAVAERTWQQILSIEPNHPSARFRIAALHGEAVDAAPPDFVRNLFEKAATSYDVSVGGTTGYRPAVDAVALLEQALPDQGAFERFADLGCGTGLGLAALRDAFRIDAAMGIDVSAKMIELAAQKNIYDRLMVGDVVPVLGKLDERFDLVMAIELAPYLGDLSALINSVTQSLVAEGYFLCSIARSEARVSLTKNGRFTHSETYVKEVARARGLEFVAGGVTTLPTPYRSEAEGLLLLFRRV